MKCIVCNNELHSNKYNYKHDGKGCNHTEQIEDFKKDNN